MIRINKLIIAFVCMFTASIGFASHKPTKKSEVIVTSSTEYDKEIADIKMKLCACTHETPELPPHATRLATLLKKRIEELIEQQKKANNPMHAFQLRDFINADQTLLDNIHDMLLLNDLLQEVTAQPVKLNHESMLTYIATMEHILEAQQKLITGRKNNQAFMSLAAIDKLLAECNAIKKPIMEAIEKESHMNRPILVVDSKKSRENFVKLMILISTDQINEIKACVAQCVVDNPHFFKEKDEAGLTVLMIALNPICKATSDAITLIASHSEIDACSSTEDTALCMAIAFSNQDHVNALLASNASVNVGFETDDTPFVKALKRGNDKITNIILGKVLMLKDIVLKNNHLIIAADWLKKNSTPKNQQWIKTIATLGKNLIEKELTRSNPELSLAVEKYALHKKAQANQAALELNAQSKTEEIPEFTLAQTAMTEKREKQKKQEEKVALEKAKKEKRREALERANAKQRELEKRAQKSLYPAAAGAGAKRNNSDTNCSALKEEDEQAQEIARRKALAKLMRKNKKNQADIDYAQNTKAAPIGTPLATNLGNLGNQLNPLLRVHLLNNNNPYPKNGRMLPLNIITAYLHNMPERAAANTR